MQGVVRPHHSQHTCATMLDFENLGLPTVHRAVALKWPGMQKLVVADDEVFLI